MVLIAPSVAGLQNLKNVCEVFAIDEDKLYKKSVCIYVHEHKYLKTLLFLIRDWRGIKEFKFGEDQGKQYLDKFMATDIGDQGEENKEVRNNISKVFTNLRCYLMPSPGDDVCEGNAKCVIGETSQRFQEHFMNLMQTLFASGISEVQRIDGRDMTCGILCRNFQELTDSINRGKGFDITSMAEANAISHEFKMYRKVLNDFDARIKKILETYQDDVKGIMDKEKEFTLEDFKKKCGPSPSKEYGVQEEELGKKLDGQIQTFRSDFAVKE
ncbi:atlastin-1-like, partial [Anneissia japonica]|uniref:atlastin-1-like n=1 Tax=Anneissia japonica TaxID=1529436 RepID=UPI00142562CD